jgi:hypothetical protein
MGQAWTQIRRRNGAKKIETAYTVMIAGTLSPAVFVLLVKHGVMGLLGGTALARPSGIVAGGSAQEKHLPFRSTRGRHSLLVSKF